MDTKIILAEDSETDAFMTKKAFKDAGIDKELVWVKDGEEFIEYLKREGRYKDRAQEICPHLIILDLNMPRKDGFECLKELHEKGQKELSKIPVIVFTTSSSEGDIKESHRLGASSYMTKPFEYVRYQEVVENFKKFWLDSASIPAVRV